MTLLLTHLGSSMQHLKPLVLLLLTAILLASCQNKITPENLARVTLGMSTKQVESILGKPSSVETTELPLLSTVKYGYVQGHNSITLVFINDKLIDKQGTLGKKPLPTEPSQD